MKDEKDFSGQQCRNVLQAGQTARMRGTGCVQRGLGLQDGEHEAYSRPIS